MSAFSCAFCGKRISPDARDTCQKVTGWIERRKGGGAHSVRMASAPIALAHQFCLDQAVDRIKVTDQPHLF